MNSMSITKKELPVSPERREELSIFCRERTVSGLLKILGNIPDVLRSDYLDKTLPMPDRAIRNLRVMPLAWRIALRLSCLSVAMEAMRGCHRKNIAACYPWRAGLAFSHSFFQLGIGQHLHIGLKRNEEEPHQTGEIYLPLVTSKFNGHIDRVIISDPMLATGGSFVTVIEQLLEFFPPEKIILASVVAAPEGIFNLANLYPGIKVISAALDSHLNELGYIQPGLGDAGDKFFDRVDLEYFQQVKSIFSSEEWLLLVRKIQEANPVD